MCRFSGQELLDDGLDVQNGRAVNRIEFTYLEGPALHRNHPADRASDTVGTILRPLREDSDLRP